MMAAPQWLITSESGWTYLMARTTYHHILGKDEELQEYITI